MKLILDKVYGNELRTFLLSQDCIVDVNIVVQDFITEIDIKYNKNIIPKIIMNYINLFEKSEYPIMMGFDSKKNDDTKVLKYVVSDLCCEYCLKGMIEELLLINGIEKVNTNFDYINKKDVVLNIEYDNELITKENIKILENKFNS